MKSTLMFRDQVSAIASWFEQWNECEQTVALYSLLKKILPVQARFLTLVLEQTYANCLDLKLQEQEANDPAYINSLCNESKESAVMSMLCHLPLLHPGNQEAKYQYLSLIPKILAHSIENSVHIEESRQLLSYSLIHPAISNDDRRSLSQWLRHLEDHISNCNALYFQPLHSGNLVGNGNDRLSQLNGNNTLGSLVFGSHQANGWCSSGNPLNVNNARDDYMNALNPNCNPLGGGGLGSNSLPPGLGGNHVSLQAMNSAPHSGLSSFSQGVSHSLPLYHSRLLRSSSLTPTSSANTTTLNNHHNLHPNNLVGHTGSGNNGGGVFNNESGSLDWPSSNNDCLNDCDYLSNRNNGKISSSNSMGNSSIHHPRGGGGGGGNNSILSPSEHAPLSPQSSIASSGSGSESHTEDQKNSFNTEGSGMKDVPSWLKTLRLHKYAHLFSQMTYEEMMNLSEDQLEAHNVTKGARHKIVLSVMKLQERPKLLRALEKDLQDGSSLKTALTEVKSIIQTPMKAFDSLLNHSSSQDHQFHHNNAANAHSPSPINGHLMDCCGEGPAVIPDADLPGLITRVMGKMCSNLLVQARPDEDCLNMFLMLIEKCLSHEAFNPTQKRRLFSWKQQVQKVWHPLPPRRSLDSRQSKGKWVGGGATTLLSSSSSSSSSNNSTGPDCGSSPLVLSSSGPDYGGGSQGPSVAAGSAANPPTACPSSSSSSGVGVSRLRRLPKVMTASSSAYHGRTSSGNGSGAPGPPGTSGNGSGAGLTPSQMLSGLSREHQQNDYSSAVGNATIQQRNPLSLVVKRPSLQDHLKPHVNIQRTHSAPVRFNPLANTLLGKNIDDCGNDPEINTRLESLCLSMTEHALGALDENSDSLSSPGGK